MEAFEERGLEFGTHDARSGEMLSRTVKNKKGYGKVSISFLKLAIDYNMNMLGVHK